MSATENIVTGAAREPLRELLHRRGIDRFVVLCDANVRDAAHRLFRGIPGKLGSRAFELSERRKSLATVENVVEALMHSGADRGTIVVGVGGGIASDLFGFAASVFMRGVPYVHVATSLVAMVDAAIGGKTGVDTPSGKNLAGTFAEPLATIAWVDALRTLPYRHVREGLAEIVKAGVIEGDELFESLETLAPHPFARWPWEDLVGRAQQVKVAIVNDDKHERGMREILNLGHTFGHALERASAYRISHGAGVSIGLRGAGLLALRTGRFSKAEHLRVLTLLTLLRLPGVTSQQPARVFSAMHADKKRRAGKLRFVLPRAIGDVEYGIQVPDSCVERVLDQLRRIPGGREFQ